MNLLEKNFLEMIIDKLDKTNAEMEQHRQTYLNNIIDEEMLEIYQDCTISNFYNTIDTLINVYRQAKQNQEKEGK